jgi:hypothetical protein
MKEVEVRHGLVALIDDEDWEAVSVHDWRAMFSNGRPYAYSLPRKYFGSHRLSMHRLIMQPMVGVEVDHVSGDTLDNRRANLRVASHAENMRNRKTHRNNTSGFKGVYRAGERWRAQLCIDSKNVCIGRFDTAREAAEAYDRSARLHYGDFARTNFPINQ